ncbi:MAG: sulfatase-like hydrolase/transferase [Planctomycetes bacterium]|nr:sulfatase-like hydrolase/transferase [Planctomycetota bacterium]
MILLTTVQAAERRPNIVFIMSDDQDWRHFGFMGGDVHTPNLDKMVENGIWLTDFNVTSTVCSPSRYSFLTGRYAGRCEGGYFTQLHPKGTPTQVENVCELEADKWNLAKVLQHNGYRTGFVGKSHLVQHDWLYREKWKKYGFKEYSFDDDPKDPKITAKMKFNHKKWCDEIAKYGFDFVDGIYAANTRELWNDSLDVHNLDWSVSKAFKFLEESKEEPFFLYFATTLQHGPDPCDSKNSVNADPRMSGEGYLPEQLDVLPSRENVRKRNRKAGKSADKDCFLWLDDGVGAILGKLKELGLEENTLVIFTPDHGYYRYCKSTLHDYGMRVPMLMQWKGKIKPGLKYDGLSANIDIVPTLLDIAGVKAPRDYPMDGVSLKSALMGDSKPVREMLFSEMGYSRAVKSKDWKYIAVRYPKKIQRRIDAGGMFAAFEGNPAIDRPYLTRNAHLGHNSSQQNPHYFDSDQLYNLKRDRAEDDNVFNSNPEVAKVMQRALEEELCKFPNRPFGEFNRGHNKIRPSKIVKESMAIVRDSSDEAQMSQVQIKKKSAWTSKRREGHPTYFYFKVKDPELRKGSFSMVDLEIEYLNVGNTEVILQYDSEKSGFAEADRFWVGDNGEWSSVTIECDNARFSGKTNGGDFRLMYIAPNTNPVISKIKIKQVQ